MGSNIILSNESTQSENIVSRYMPEYLQVLWNPKLKVTYYNEEYKLSYDTSSSLIQKAKEPKSIEALEKLQEDIIDDLHQYTKGNKNREESKSEPLEENKEEPTTFKELKTSKPPPLNQSPHWRRVDVRQKKITRGLSQLSKSFIQKYLKKKPKGVDVFMYIDDLIQR